MKKIICILIFLLACVPVLAVEIEESFEQTLGQDGSTTSWDEHYSDSSGSTDIHTEHSTDANGNVHESQTITHTDAEGNTYSETHTWDYDAETGETTEGHSENGTPPPEPPSADPVDDGGAEAAGQANGEDVTSDYGEGGTEDHWGDPEGDGHTAWNDVTTNTSGMIFPGSKTASQSNSVPARTIPLICQIAGLGYDYIDKMSDPIPEFDKIEDMDIEQAMELAKKLSAKLPRLTEEITQDTTGSFESNMVIKEIHWNALPYISGYKTKHYKIFGNGKIRADIWIIPQINIYKILTGGKEQREANTKRLLIPSWAKGQQQDIFKKLVVRYKERFRKNNYRVKQIKKLPEYVFKQPAIPADYKVSEIRVEDMQKQLMESLKKMKKM